MIGSQWWCLRRQTVERVLEFAQRRRDVTKFFKTTWIPDETYFQTVVRHLVSANEIETRSLTFLMFSDYGMPVSFYNDHYDLLLSQDYLFARKISPGATDLRARLGELYASGRMAFETSNEGQTLFRFLTGRGRVGRRFGRRFWERQASIGRDRTLLVIACKKWHVAKRLLHRIMERTEVRGIEYLFDEEGTPMPDLGGIEVTRDKRTRHHRALLRLIYEHYDTEKLVICLDPSNLELMHDLFSDAGTTKLLEIGVGLAGEMTPQDTINRLLPTVRHTFEFEADQIRDANFPNSFEICEVNADEANIAALAGFLDVAADVARDILDVDYLFVD